MEDKCLNEYFLVHGAILFFACGDESVINVSDEAKEKASISFLVVDYYSGEPIDSVTIYNMKQKKSNVTDSLGFSISKDNQIGSYGFELSKDGYATLRTFVSVEEKGLGDVARVPDVTSTIKMYKLGVEVSGTVLYTDKKTGNKVAASDITLILSNQNTLIIPKEITVKTDEDGNYTFSDLPEGSNFIISIPQTMIDGYKYSLTSSINVSADRAGAIRDLGVQNLSMVTDEFTLVNSNLTKVDTNSTVSLTFSAALDPDSVVKNVVVKRGSVIVLSDVSLSEDGKTINIKPFSGLWDNKATYTISGAIFSKSGGRFNISSSFTVGATKITSTPEHVSDLDIELEGSLLELTWTVEDTLVNGYNIYYKTDSMSHYLALTNESGYSESSSISYANLLPKNVDSTKISFIVLPYNNVGEADPKTAKSVSYTFKNPTAQVSDLSVELNSSYAYLTWVAPKTGTYKYRIYYKTPSMNDYDTLNVTSNTYYESSYTVSHYLGADDKSISFKVLPYDNFGQSNFSKADAVSLLFDVDAVVGVTAVIDGDNFKVSWSKMDNASSYYVYYKTSTMSTFTQTAYTTSTFKNFDISSYYDAGSESDTTISFKVVPYNVVNGQGSLEDATIAKIDYPVPEVVKNLNVVLNEGNFDITWTKSTETDVTAYVVYYKTNTMADYDLMTSSNTATAIVPLTSYVEESDTEISFKVIAQNRYGRQSSLADATPVTISLETDPASEDDPL